MEDDNRRFLLAIFRWSLPAWLPAAMLMWLSLICIPQAWAKQQFFAAPEYPTGHQPQAVATGDFNGDGKADLVTSNTLANTVSILLVAVATALDALKRTSIGDGTGVGLRAGTFETSFDDDGNQTITLTNCGFAKDVTVNGAVVWGGDLSLAADLTVSGTGTAGGILHLEGTWQAPGSVGNFKISGTLGGRQVAVLVPEA